MIITTATTAKDLSEIKKLQSTNLKAVLSPEQIISEGFLTAEYTLDFIAQMNEITPAVIAKEKERVVGYALVTTKGLLTAHPLLKDLMHKIDALEYKGALLGTEDYVVVGQLCVAKSHRGMGLAKQLYQGFKTTYAHRFPYCITDVDLENPRSLQAHIKTGFKVIGILTYGGSQWNIVLWDWNA